MKHIYHILLTSLIIVGSANATVETRVVYEITPENAYKNSIDVHITQGGSDCRDKEIWISVPSNVTAANLTFKDQQGNDLLGASLAIVTLPPDPSLSLDSPLPRQGSFAHDWLIGERARIGFLVQGFHGVRICTVSNAISGASVDLVTGGMILQLGVVHLGA